MSSLPPIVFPSDSALDCVEHREVERQRGEHTASQKALVRTTVSILPPMNEDPRS